MSARPASKIDVANVVGHFINGADFPDDNRPEPITNPATGKVTRHVAMASRQTVESAIAAAETAFPAWRNTPPAKRARIMFRFKQLLEEHADEIAAAITDEHGKVLDDAMGEFGRGVEVVDYACGIPELLKGEYTRNVGPGIDSWSDHQPLGVVAGITPFNFPAMVPMWMYPMAIACGNTFVLKPSEKDPSAPMIVARLFKEAGLPDGVFNLVNGDKEAVDTLLNDPRIQAVSFVGSTPVAEYIYRTGTKNGKRVQALGGAKNHAIIMPDADVDNAVNALMGAAFGSCGERCMAISVAVCVGDDTADTVVGKLQEETANLKVGAGTDNANHMGPLVTKAHHEKVRGYVDLGVEEGADLVADGRGLVVAGHEDGYFLGPCLFDRVTPDMRIYQEEIFGPVLCVVRAESEEQAMQMIDDHEFGNGTCIFTRDGEAARYFADNIKVGMVGINVPLPVPVAYHSFGGWKRSLFGDLYAYGPDSIRFYTRRKTITQRWPSGGVREKAQFSFPGRQ
ncbi:MAG: CoA-acylating methylmalonate-semialdehyde dehydrogenase [Gammaproteobacteria bacterium]|nr:CoA-acylating methylmalonate-semialdehyde dehydrogenase [Gammaproteobacteria bacterium]MBT8109747.1 CoA-acylating methylmalonate-semialdehyde dehydrogenase [Gammaproteobacteria bacterium]NND47854.1 CoA-acylating methylmalonate-semialdehyde dehydrogenase [Woeseiaceae bacterium]NNL44448.1 CoA-acylating methylmalonate-semialdehyde dehydrogenase [Woeseiaceae bacterium]